MPKKLKIFNTTKRQMDFARWETLAEEYHIFPEVLIIDPSDEYRTRGLGSNYPIIVILDSEDETQDSLFWIFCHEIRHLIVENSKILSVSLYNQKREILYQELSKNEKFKNDPLMALSFMPEEFEADAFATEKTGGYYGILWKLSKIPPKNKKIRGKSLDKSEKSVILERKRKRR